MIDHSPFTAKNLAKQRKIAHIPSGFLDCQRQTSAHTVVTELRNLGIQDIFITCEDGLKGFSEAIEAVYPLASVQLCVAHMAGNSLNFVSWKMRAEVAADLKRIYTATKAADEAEQRLGEFEINGMNRTCPSVYLGAGTG